MEYSIYSALCEAFGNPDAESVDKWKSIAFINCDDTNRFDVQSLYNQNKFYMIGDGSTGTPTGALIVENAPAEHRSITPQKIINFLDMERFIGVSFIADPNENIESALAKLGITLTPTFQFTQNEFTIHDPLKYSEVRYKVSEPVTIKVGVYTDEATRDAATDPSESIGAISAKGTYYLRAFVGNDMSVTGDTTVIVEYDAP